jgi:hypothetical protein
MEQGLQEGRPLPLRRELSLEGMLKSSKFRRIAARGAARGDREPQISKSYFAPSIGPREHPGRPR